MTNQLNILNEASFYKTIPMTPAEHQEAETQAISQEERIFQHLKETGLELTAWQLKDKFDKMEIISIRRSLFNLEMKQGRIVQTGWVMGPKRVKVGLYKST